MAARSVVAKFANKTRFDLSLANSEVQHGHWVTSPPSSIAAGAEGQWETDSDGYAGGTSGDLQYQFTNEEGTQTVTVSWMVPFEGSSNFDIHCDAAGVQPGYTGGGQDPNATVNYYLNQA